MKIGVSLSNYGLLASREFLKETAIEIEHQQLDSIWLSDHIIVPKNNDPWTRVFESVTTLGFLSSITEKIQLGSSILLVPLRNPFVLAKQIATLDSLSNGRIIFGVGIGWNKKEFDLLGYGFENRTKSIVDNIRIIKDMWAGHYSKQCFSCEPMPVSPNGPPILVGGQSEGALRRVSSIGDGWHPVGISVHQYETGMQRILQLCRRDYLWTLRINFVANKQVDSSYTGADGNTRLRLSGTVDEIISKIQKYQEIGLDHLVCDVKADSKSEYIEQIQILGKIKRSF